MAMVFVALHRPGMVTAAVTLNWGGVAHRPSGAKQGQCRSGAALAAMNGDTKYYLYRRNGTKLGQHLNNKNTVVIVLNRANIGPSCYVCQHN